MSETHEFDKTISTRTQTTSTAVGGDPARINICQLDSHSAVRFGLECKIRSQYDIHWIGSGSDFREVAALLREFTCDVVIVEYQLEGLENDGWNLIKQFQRNFPDTRLLVYTGYMSQATQALITRAGVSCVLSKRCSMDKLISVIRELGFASWHSRFHGDRKRPKPPEIQFDSMNIAPASNNEALDGAGLSTREMEVLRCLLQGMSVSEISHKFVRSIKTISSQKQAAFRKLSVSSNQDLFRLQKSFHIR
jgi:two-component system capsular synthesis response regulator RcsB